MTRYVLWGTARAAEDWDETILLSDASLADVSKVRKLAHADGFRNIRAVPLDSLRPDFAATVTV